jgi:carbon-monoxide dehydrogenase large subunit
MSLVGARVVRKEDPNLLTGRGRFVDDLTLPGMLFAKPVLSTEPHAELAEIDLSAALALPGVHGAYTAQDFSGYPYIPGPEDLQRPVLADGKVQFVGEPVAFVLADDRYIAADAAELVQVRYRRLPAVASVEQALAEGAPVILDGQESNQIHTVPMLDDLERELQASALRASLRLVNNRCAPVPIEPVACLADWTPDGLTVWATFQAPHHLRNTLSRWLDVPQNRCRVIAPDVGGGFGSKIVWYPELFVVPLLSKWHGRPVKSAMTRSEAMLAMSHGRDQIHDLDVGFERDGRINALRMVVTQNLGAWPDVTGVGLPVLTTWMAAGCYAIPKVSVGYRTVVTNTTPVAAYRGAGRPEAAYAIERVVDLVADVSGVDPSEVRFRNFIPPHAFPYRQKTNNAVVYDSGDFPHALETLLELMDYESLKQEREERRADPTRPLMGIGFSTWLEIAGFGPNGSLEAFGHLASWESAHIRIQPDGTAIVWVGSSPHGQGHETVFAQIASDELGMPFDDIVVRHGDTETVLQGMGTFGSRAVPTAGEAVKNVATRIREKAKLIASHLLEASPLDIIAEAGGFHVIGSPGATVSWADVAWASFQPLSLPENLRIGSLEERICQESPNFSYPSGAYGCVVGVDRDTGRVTVERYIVVDDCGKVINPLLAEGQVHGGVAQGIAQALFEEMSYGDDAHPQRATLEEYLVPTAPDIPPFVAGRIETPTPNNSLGAKGIGESGAVGAPPAVVNAVVDALSHLGVRHLDMPLGPERVWRAMQAAQEGT